MDGLDYDRFLFEGWGSIFGSSLVEVRHAPCLTRAALVRLNRYAFWFRALPGAHLLGRCSRRCNLELFLGGLAVEALKFLAIKVRSGCQLLSLGKGHSF
jgi:hypothetical protein